MSKTFAASEDILTLPAPKADVRVAYGSDPNQFFDLRRPRSKGPHALAICLHGGFWRKRYDLEYCGHLCSALTANGITTANLEYRRVGNPGGGWPGTFSDVRGAFQFLLQNSARYGFSQDRVVVLGHSAGGQLALCLAAHEPALKAAISLAGVIDLRQTYDLHLSNNAVVEFLGGTPSEVPEHYREADPMKLAIRAHQWLVHGMDDDTVPPEFSENYAKTKTKAKEDARPVLIAGAGHFEVVDPRAAKWAEVEKIVLQACGKTAGG